MARYHLVLIALLTTCMYACELRRMPAGQAPDVKVFYDLVQAGKAAELDSYSSADSFFHAALTVAKRAGNDSCIFWAHRYLLYNEGVMQASFDSGRHWANLLLDDAEAHPSFKAGAYSSVGTLFNVHLQLDSASWYFQQAIPLAEAANDTVVLASLYQNMSGLYYQLQNNQLAKEYQLRTIALVRKDSNRLFSAYTNAYMYCDCLGETALAAKYRDSAALLLQRHPGNANALHLYSYLAQQHMLHRQYDSARHFAGRQLVYAQRLNDSLLIIKSHLILTEALYGLGQNTGALRELDTARRLMEKYPPTADLAHDAASESYKLYKATGSSGQALNALEQLARLDSAANMTERASALHAFEQAREATRAEKKILTQQLLVNRKNTTILLLGAIVVSLALLVSSIIWYHRRQRILQQRRLQYAAAETEWQHTRALLEAQLEERNRISRELHDDLGASLTSIALAGNIIRSKAPGMAPQEMAIISDTASDMVQTLNEIVWTLNNRNDSLYGLLAYIRKFAAGFLEKAGITFSMAELPEGTEDVPVASAIRRSLYLACKEAIHNVVKHSGAKQVRLAVVLDAGLLKLSIIDDGRGINASNASAGNGLLNIKKALEVMGGECSIDSSSGMTVTLMCRITDSISIA